MARRLRITKKQLVDVNFEFLGAFRLRVEIDDPTNSGADPNVFVYNRRPMDVTDRAISDVFSAVASPVDLAEYPVGEPIGTTTYPFYRLSYVELDLRSTKLAEEVWLTIVREVTTLLQILDRMEQLVPVAEIWIGDPPSSASSDSISTSTSVTG